ncbi:MAG: hypothetical protein AM325_000835 [Candidatus Thorarchaeota archaeon SMTZ1-45]|nr:MAG: hypothetical protein AM325_02220 [Candidatus Thorarchaeota archaeon SMTZ1-45]
MLDKILTENFRRTLKLVFTDIQNQQDRRDEQEFAKDEVRIKDRLLDTFISYSPDVILNNDFRIAAIDGSGSDSLMTLDDIRIHFISTSTVVVDTNTRSENLFSPIDRDRLEHELGEQPHIDLHWHSGVRNDARDKLAETLANIYPLKDVTSLTLPFFQDYTKGKISSFSDFSETEYEKHIPRLREMESLISREQLLTNPTVHEEIRKTSEYAAARKVLMSDINPKYLLLDGAMSVFMHFVRHFPSMPSGFMLRDLCALARQKEVVLCAVSKNHTIPFAHRIANLARDAFGGSAKWFCHLPSSEDPEGGLHIYDDRTYIPPILAVPYLYSFSRDNRPSRIDFDRIWWLENIFVPGDPEATRTNEKALFAELEFMSRDARWYGYPVPLALAHESCKLSYEDLRLAKEVCMDVRAEMNLERRDAQPLRADYDL